MWNKKVNTMITVTAQSTAERNQETRHLFEQIKPLLDEGYNYSNALVKIGRIPYHQSLIRRAWFRDLIEYGKSQGYSYHHYKGKGFKR